MTDASVLQLEFLVASKYPGIMADPETATSLGQLEQAPATALAPFTDTIDDLLYTVTKGPLNRLAGPMHSWEFADAFVTTVRSDIQELAYRVQEQQQQALVIQQEQQQLAAQNFHVDVLDQYLWSETPPVAESMQFWGFEDETTMELDGKFL